MTPEFYSEKTQSVTLADLYMKKYQSSASHESCDQTYLYACKNVFILIRQKITRVYLRISVVAALQKFTFK